MSLVVLCFTVHIILHEIVSLANIVCQITLHKTVTVNYVSL
ncbi:hypothetical protein GLYMA_18G124850v4 [Glycine max]|nr:hypothetical protein GLYMA_18G124850v4 [Glycine max]KAH1154269.1 hypothetical protein GYH30_049783 [Glycine max]